jgi:hypothetical protein
MVLLIFNELNVKRLRYVPCLRQRSLAGTQITLSHPSSKKGDTINSNIVVRRVQKVNIN